MPLSASPVNSFSSETSPFSPLNTEPLEDSLKTLSLSNDLQQKIAQTASLYLRSKKSFDWTKAEALKPGSMCAIQAKDNTLKMAIATDTLLGKGTQGKISLARVLHIDRQTQEVSFSRPKALIQPHDFTNQNTQQRLKIHQAVHPCAGIAKAPKQVQGAEFFLQHGYDDTVYKKLTRIDSKNQESNRLSLKERLNILIDVADGLHAMHKKGYYHRDVHADNVMLEFEEGKIRACLNDFDLSQAKEIYDQNAVPEWLYSLDTCSQNGFVNTIAMDIYELTYLIIELLNGDQTPFFVRDYHDIPSYELLDFLLEKNEKNSLPSLKQQVLTRAITDILYPVLLADQRLTRNLRDYFCIPLYVSAKEGFSSISRNTYEPFQDEPLAHWCAINKCEIDPAKIESLRCSNEEARKRAQDIFCYREIEGPFSDLPEPGKTNEELAEEAEFFFPSAQEIGDALRSIRDEFFP